jgi:hypothetical protein
MRFDRQPETKSCLGKINFKVGTQVLYFKNTQTKKIIKKPPHYNGLSTKANK